MDPHGSIPPCISRFTDVTASWYDREASFRLSAGSKTLFAHGKPNNDLINQLVKRFLSSPSGYIVLGNLFADYAYPIQKYWPAIAAKKILDACFVSLIRRPNADRSGESQFLVEKIFDIAATSPEACQYLLPVLVFVCTQNVVEDEFGQLLCLLDMFGIGVQRGGPKLIDWMKKQPLRTDQRRMITGILERENDGKCIMFAKFWERDEVLVLEREARERLNAI
ncbi:hypothetical protein PM082_008903 [Marasmius tenuissimus]|nr:hypothetical protein PM082_008903 [Marasmius tenuissimus]